MMISDPSLFCLCVLISSLPFPQREQVHLYTHIKLRLFEDEKKLVSKPERQGMDLLGWR